VEFTKYSAKSYFKATILIGKEIAKITDDITKIRKVESDFLQENEKLISNRNEVEKLVLKNKEKNTKETEKQKNHRRNKKSQRKLFNLRKRKT